MTTSNSENPKHSAAADGKKSVPINHVILKRVTDIKAMVGDLAESRNSAAATDQQLTTEVQRQSSELVAIKDQLQEFQQNILAEFCVALDERLANQPVQETPSELPTQPQSLRPSQHFVQSESHSPAEPDGQDQSNANDDAENSGLKEDTWASIRSAFLVGHQIDAEEDPASDPAISATESEVSNQQQQLDSVPDSEVAEEPSLVEIDGYEVVADLDSLDEPELRETVENQERVISMLIRKLQTRQINRPTMTPEQLAAVQELAEEDLALEIRETLAILHDLQRQGELELSLERARLSRRRTDLDQLQERIEGRARTLGVVIKDDGTIDDIKAAERGLGSKSRRWLGAMGFGEN